MGDFLQFDVAKTNMLADEDYVASTYRTGGCVTGIAPSNVHNNLFYQLSTMVKALADAMVAKGYTVSDESLANLITVLQNIYTAADGILVPTGTLLFFPASSAPAGFLKANGAAISRTTYAALWAWAQAYSSVVSEVDWAATKWGCFSVGDGATTFRLPDLRGEFMRGLDDSRGVDTSRVLGKHQLDAFQGHTWQSYIAAEAINSGGITVGGIDSGTQSLANYGLSIISDGVNGTPRVASETRPRNIAWLACIKY